MNSTAPIAVGLMSVVCSCGRSLASTELCIGSLLRDTRRPWELIAVVDGPGPVAAYLAGIRDAAPIHVEIVDRKDAEASPFTAGFRAAGGDAIAWVADGTIVTDAWLDQLAALLASNPKIGAVGPMSNDAAPPQRAEGSDGPDLAALQQFAGRWRSEHRGQWLFSQGLAESCMLVGRRAYEAAGGAEIRSAGELAGRLRAIGLSLAVAYDLFVYHVPEGSEETAESWERARSNRWIPKGSKPEAVRAPGHSGPGVIRERTGRRQGGVSLTMIVRNEEANLADCLESATGLFDEVIVADTGSTDRTAQIARQFGAKVVEFAWVDDFAAARNAALEQSSCRYAFWLDADDRIDEPNRRRLRTLFDSLREDDHEAAYVMKQLSVSQDRVETTTSADHVRLFPVRDDVWWTYRVHEQILPALRAAGVPVRFTDIGIGHVGYVDAALRDAKLGRNLRILLAELRERPSDPFVLFNIGWVAIDRHDPKGAIGYLRASLAASAPGDSIVRKTYVLIARAYQALGDLPSALAACRAGRELDPDDAELLFRESLVRRETGDFAGAEAGLRRILTLPRPAKFSSVVTGIFGHLTRRLLAGLAEQRGDQAEAARLWTDVMAECPADPEALAALGRLRRESTGPSTA